MVMVTLTRVKKARCWSYNLIYLCDHFSVLQVRKPLVEKQRRARINESLQELRALADDVSTAGHIVVIIIIMTCIYYKHE